jgi:hypothetical protein
VPCAFSSVAAIPAADLVAGFVEIGSFVEGTAVDVSSMIVIPSMYDQSFLIDVRPVISLTTTMNSACVQPMAVGFRKKDSISIAFISTNEVVDITMFRACYHFLLDLPLLLFICAFVAMHIFKLFYSSGKSTPTFRVPTEKIDMP